MSVHIGKPTPATSEKIVKEKAICSRSERFRGFAQKTSCAVGSPVAFAIAVAALVIWAAFGPATKFSDTWQLVVNTATTIVTFLMVFLIQNTQSMERQADQVGMETMIKSDWDPHQMITFFNQLAGEQKTQPSKLEAFFSSHPPPADRAQYLTAQLQKAGNKSGNTNEEAIAAIKPQLPPANTASQPSPPRG